jgi:hypothetical protein
MRLEMIEDKYEDQRLYGDESFDKWDEEYILE